MAFLANVSVLSTLIFPKGKILRPTNWNGLSSLGLSSMQVLISGTRRRNAKFSNRTTLLSNCAGTWGEADFVRTHSKTRVLFPLAHACLWCMLLSSRDISITCCWTSLLISSWKAGDTAAIGRCEFGLNKDGWSKSSSGGDGGFMLFTSFMFGEDCTDEPVVIKPRLLLLNRHHLIQNGFKHRFARSQRRVLVLHFPTSYVLPINLSVSHDPSTIITLSTCQTDLKRRFLFVCKTSERWAMFKALGRRSYPRFLFFCLWGVSDLQSRNLSWFIFRYSYHDSIHNSQLSNKCLLFLILIPLQNPGSPVPSAIPLAPEKASKLRVGQFQASGADGRMICCCNSFDCICLLHFCHSFCAFGTELTGTVFAEVSPRGIQWWLWDNRAAWLAWRFCLCGLDVSEPGIGVRELEQQTKNVKQPSNLQTNLKTKHLIRYLQFARLQNCCN